MKCTQYGLYGQVAFKNAKVGLGRGVEALVFLILLPPPPPRCVQRLSGVFRDARWLAPHSHMQAPTLPTSTTKIKHDIVITQ
jgi:hypothetical protein